MLTNTKEKLKVGSKSYQFTPRQLEIIKLLVQGKKNQEIADQLFIQLGSVKFHVTNIIKKLGVTSRAEVMAKYFKAT